MLLRSDALPDCCIALLLVDGFDDVRKLSSLVSRCLPVGDDFVPSLCSLTGCFPAGLETLAEWIGRREAGIGSLTLNACLLLDSGVLEFGVVFSASSDVSHGRAHLLVRAPSLDGRLGDFRWINRAENRPRRRLFPFTTTRFRGFVGP